MKATETQPNQREGLWSRLRARLSRKPPHPPSIAAVMSQWAEYELIFNDILQRLNAQLARQAKFEKKALERLTQDNGEALDSSLPVLLTSKQQLRSAWAAQRYGGVLQSLQNTKEARE